MSDERRKIVIVEIKEIAERIESILNNYKEKYYKKIPYNSKRKIYHNLEEANIYVQKLMFAYNADEDIFSREISKVKEKCTLDSICDFFENAVNENLKYYNNDIADMILTEKRRIQDRLRSINIFPFDYAIKFQLITEKLNIENCFFESAKNCPGLRKLQETITEIEKNCYLGNIHEVSLIELYGIKTLLLELEDRLTILKVIQGGSCCNIVSEYIDNMIDINKYKEIK